MDVYCIRPAANSGSAQLKGNAPRKKYSIR